MLSSQEQFSIQEMCRVLNVSRSGFYAFQACPQSEHTKRDILLKTDIQSLFNENAGRYGSPRIYRELRAQGITCSPKRVARLMRELELVATKPRRFAVTTDSNHSFPVASNLLSRD